MSYLSALLGCASRNRTHVIGSGDICRLDLYTNYNKQKYNLGGKSLNKNRHKNGAPRCPAMPKSAARHPAHGRLPGADRKGIRDRRTPVPGNDDRNVAEL